MHGLAKPHFERIAGVFYDRILQHDKAREVLVGGESTVGQLKVKLVEWMDRLLNGPWDEAYFAARSRIGRVHVRINLPQHYMFGAMDVLRLELSQIADAAFAERPQQWRASRMALAKILDLELAVMLHTYREDLLEQQGRVERLAVFGQLVGSIGHELRNPLGVMETSLFIAKQRAGEDERMRKHLDRLGEQLGIANQIVTDLLDILRDKPLLKESVQLAPILDAAIRLVRVPPNVRIVLEGIEDVPAFPGDAGQLRQAFVNLIENGVHAASPDGEVRVQGRIADMVEVTVRDTGAGIDPAIQRRLFEPLVTTKARGIGLGLTLVKRITERHGGTVTCVSHPGEGARFIVRLPRA
jgi:signal transduction histidine kinase